MQHVFQNRTTFGFCSLHAKIVSLCIDNLSVMSEEEATKCDAIDERVHSRWKDIWCTEEVPKFDKGCPCPALVDLEMKGEVPMGRALVPGMGRGYDVTFLARPERDVYGVDIVEVCGSVVDNVLLCTHLHLYASAFFLDDTTLTSSYSCFQECLAAANKRLCSLSDEEVCKSSVHFELASFFDLPAGDENEQFDFIYDYTFFCAIDPSLRAEWADKMFSLLKPGGILCTLIYPIMPRDGGPPFEVDMEVYRKLLAPRFSQLQLEMLPDNMCHPGREGKCALGRWKK